MLSFFVNGTGGFHRRLDIGGLAYGIPLNTYDEVFSPSIGPHEV